MKTAFPLQILLVCIPFGVALALTNQNPTVGSIEQTSGVAADYPVKPGQSGKVKTLDFPAIEYGVYLPSAYDPASKEGYPVLYTFSLGGGGMVEDFRAIAEESKMIVIGHLESRNGGNADVIGASTYAIIHDVTKRLCIDPSAQFAAGFSGGATVAYGFCKYNAPLLAGVFAAGGWLGASFEEHWFLKDLLVARSCGKGDAGALGYVNRDRDYMKKFNVKIKDWSFDGGHEMPPERTKKEIIAWLLASRQKTNPDDVKKSRELAEKCRTLMQAGRANEVFHTCLSVMFSKPRTWQAFEAQKTAFALLADTNRFSSCHIVKTDPKISPFLSDYLAIQMYGAGGAGDAGSWRNLVRCMDECGAMKMGWYSYVAWVMVFNANPGIHDPPGALKYMEKYAKSVSPKLIYEQFSWAAAYAANGQIAKAKKVFSQLTRENAEQNDAEHYRQLKSYLEDPDRTTADKKSPSK